MAHWPRLFSGLRVRLLWVLVPVLMALLLLDSWRDSVAMERGLEKAYDQSLLEPAQALADNLGWDEAGGIGLAESFHIVSMFEALNSRHKYLRVQMQAPDGSHSRVLMGAAQLPEPAHDPHDAQRAFREGADGSQLFYNATMGHQPIRVAALLRIVHDKAGQEWRVLVQSAQGRSAIDNSVRQLLWSSLWRDVRTLLVMAVLVWLGVAWGLWPLRALGHAIGTRRPDDLQPLATDAVPPEVRPVVDALNQHLDQQRDALEAQRQFLADASHQLRTPLAILTTQAGYALRESDPAVIRATLQSMAQQLQRGRRVAEQLLALANASQQLAPQSEVPLCDANAVARDVVLAYLPQALEKQQDLGWIDARGEGYEEEDADPADDAAYAQAPMVAPVHANATALHELLANLVHNAIAYTPVSGRISVAVHVAGGKVCILVQDNGPGIAVADRERAFVRFERLHAGPAAPAGSGLGLAIARAYARRMHGDVQLGDSVDGPGLCVSVALPLALA